MYLDSEVISVIAAIAAVLMAVYVLIKTNGSREKNCRSLYLYEQYAGSIGKCISDNTPENKKEYKVNYYQLYVYIEPSLRPQMETIDEHMDGGDMENVKSEFAELSKKYGEIYDITQFSPKRRTQKGKALIQININK
ncbi:hypothetical protein V3C10_17535 [[Clostridium] symbiosum]|uniref:hypothetical protein n=1 Tax=Clostridium symbiosum TaxID=1512 RepID=UPI001D090E3F|nr:hypothetical protein [[Clostridium] symbiosum]MCB6608098.1 hypothetical protein [[Clostridium] symbiosum]MCB6931062.1 hypothetical protein [[Clostridium] symbiosum]